MINPTPNVDDGNNFNSNSLGRVEQRLAALRSRSPAHLRIVSDPDESCFGGSDDSFVHLDDRKRNRSETNLLNGSSLVGGAVLVLKEGEDDDEDDVGAVPEIRHLVDSRVPAPKLDTYKRKLVVQIKRTQDKIRHEKVARDENLAKYLHHTHVSPESKDSFERRNQRYTEHLCVYGKRLSKYESDFKRLSYLVERKKFAAPTTVIGKSGGSGPSPHGYSKTEPGARVEPEPPLLTPSPNKSASPPLVKAGSLPRSLTDKNPTSTGPLKSFAKHGNGEHVPVVVEGGTNQKGSQIPKDPDAGNDVPSQGLVTHQHHPSMHGFLGKGLTQMKAGKKDIANLFKKMGNLDHHAHKEPSTTHSSNDDQPTETKSTKSIPSHKIVTSESLDKGKELPEVIGGGQMNKISPSPKSSNASSSAASLASSSPSAAKISQKGRPNKNGGSVRVRADILPTTDSPIAPDVRGNPNPIIVTEYQPRVSPPSDPHSTPPSRNDTAEPYKNNVHHDTTHHKEKGLTLDKTSSSDRDSDFRSQDASLKLIHEDDKTPISITQLRDTKLDPDNYYSYDGDQQSTYPPKSSVHNAEGREHNNLYAQSQASINAEFEKLIQLQNQDRRNLESLRIKNQQDFASFTEAISEARFRSEHLDEQVSDIIELQQSETENLRLEIKALEEKMSYQIDDRTQDILEMMENIQTRISKLELAQQRQQIVSLEGIQMSAARNLLLKSINILLAFLQLILLITSTFAQILSPFIKTRSRTLVTLLLVIITAVILKSHPHLQRQIANLALKIFHSVVYPSRK